MIENEHRAAPVTIALMDEVVVEVGGDGRYVSVCRRHWMAGDIGPARREALGRAEAA